jgi:tetrathionate reductase subunit A
VYKLHRGCTDSRFAKICSAAQTLDGVTIPGDSRRATGVHANAAMRVDPVLKNTGLVDPVGGSAVFYQSQVKLVKV